MLQIDYREGSKDLLLPLQKMGLPATLAGAPGIDADIEFIGRGEGGVSATIGIEFKQLRECVAAMRTERLQGLQVPRMVETYEFRYLLVEGELLFNQRGMLLRRAGHRQLKQMPGSMSVGEFLKRVFVLHLRGGMNFIHTQNRKETLKYIEMLYRVWTDENLDCHKSHLGVYNPPTPVPVSAFRQAVMRWPDVGYKVSLAVEQRFEGSIRRACQGALTDWASLTTTDEHGKSRRLGEKAAQRIVDFLEGR